MFLALAFYAVESLGIELWRIEFLRRTFGWSPQKSGPILGIASLVSALTGLFLGTRLAEWLARRRDDANLRTVLICLLGLPVFRDARAADAHTVAVDRLLQRGGPCWAWRSPRRSTPRCRA